MQANRALAFPVRSVLKYIMVEALREPNVSFDRQKFLAVVHWICHHFRERPEQLGRTKLHKILYFADMLCFIESGTALTGVEYVKQPFGPTARYLGWALRELSDADQIEIKTSDYFGLRKYDFLSKAEPRSNILSEHEKALLGEVCDFVSGHTAKEIAELSHAEPWIHVAYGEPIPYGAAYRLIADRRTPSPDDISWGRRAVAEVGRAAFDAKSPR